MFFQPEGRRLGDFDIVVRGGKLYCLFIDREKKNLVPESEVGNNYGLAVSEDALNWKYLGSVMEGTAEWNKGSLWAMDVFEDSGKFSLLYSAVGTLKGEHHHLQQVGLAESEDLRKWEDKGVVISNEMTGDFYYPKEKEKFCWRDPYVFKVGEDYYCLLAAKDKEKEFEKSGCIGLFKSKDLVSWETLSPVFSPSRYAEVEVPSFYELEGKWFLLFGVCVEEVYEMHYAVSDQQFGPFKEVGKLLPTMNYVGKIVNFQGKRLLYHWVRKDGRAETFLAPPKIVEVEGDKLLLKKHPDVEVGGKFREVYENDYFVDYEFKNS